MTSLDPAKILEQYFDIHPLGVEICPGIEPPKTAWETLVYHLASNNDTLAWQIGATCNRYPKKYHSDIYGWFATLFNRTHWTIEQYSYIERHIPVQARIVGLSIWLHRPVAKIADSGKQESYLEICHERGWNITEFENWLKSINEEVENREESYQSDKAYDNERRQYQTETDNALLRKENRELLEQLKELEAVLELTPKSESFDLPPDSVPEVDNLSRPVIGWLKQVGYSSVIIYQNGRIVIKP